MGAKVMGLPPKPAFAKLHPEFEGCCMGNRATCKCGAPFFS
jgi:RNA exonuclease 4